MTQANLPTQHDSTSAGQPRASFPSAVRQALRQPAFLVAAAFLLVSAIGLNAASQFLQLHFRKVAVPLPVRSLSDETEGIPARLGAWTQATVDEPLDPEVETTLGTRQYINRIYIDSRLDPMLAAHFKGATKQERSERLGEFLHRHSTSLKGEPQIPALTLGVTYYTGLVDTVAHIPDRCYVGSGYEPSAYELRTLPPDGFPDGKKRKIQYRLINFEDQTGQGRMGMSVAYFFIVNGTYEENPLHVRQVLQDLTEKYGYYAKIEVMAADSHPEATQRPEYRAAVEAALNDFIVGALPAIESKLPDWQKIKGN